MRGSAEEKKIIPWIVLFKLAALQWMKVYAFLLNISLQQQQKLFPLSDKKEA